VGIVAVLRAAPRTPDLSVDRTGGTPDLSVDRTGGTPDLSVDRTGILLRDQGCVDQGRFPDL